MKIIYKTGDLLKASEPAILHGCNAQGKMKSGVAKDIREHYPEAYDEYFEAYTMLGNKLVLGMVIWAEANPHYIINAITQEYYGKDGQKYASYDAIHEALILVDNDDFWDDFKKPALAMPMIGSGLGGGNWNVIEAIIESALKIVQPVVYRLA